MMQPIDAEFLTSTLAGLIGINSINPAFSGGTSNEADIARYVTHLLGGLGLTVSRYEPEPGRVSVVGRLPGSGNGRSLMLYAHLDTVGVEGMPAPFSARHDRGKIYGRGAYDMKGGLAACLTAVKALLAGGTRLAGDLLVVGVADEEVASIGMADVLDHVGADAAIVTESTELDICIAHKGFCWVEVETLGRAAHGSRYEEGIDANLRMGRFLAQLDLLERQLRESAAHPLVGPPSLHAAVLHGGTGPSTYAAHCRVEIERRTIPGETEGLVLEQIGDIVGRLASADPSFQARVRPLLTRTSFEVSRDAPILRSLTAASSAVLSRTPRYIGEPYWMDAALLAAKGIDTAVIGPCGAGAHAVEEWVDLESLVQLSQILVRTASDFCGRTD